MWKCNSIPLLCYDCDIWTRELKMQFYILQRWKMGKSYLHRVHCGALQRDTEKMFSTVLIINFLSLKSTATAAIYFDL